MWWIGILIAAVLAAWAVCAVIYLVRRRKHRKNQCDGCPFRNSDKCDKN